MHLVRRVRRNLMIGSNFHRKSTSSVWLWICKDLLLPLHLTLDISETVLWMAPHLHFSVLILLISRDRCEGKRRSLQIHNQTDELDFLWKFDPIIRFRRTRPTKCILSQRTYHLLGYAGFYTSRRIEHLINSLVANDLSRWHLRIHNAAEHTHRFFATSVPDLTQSP